MAGKAVLGIENGMFSHGAAPVFENVTFMLDDSRTGLVGENGAGKTTLLKCLTGEADLNRGQIVRSSSLHFAYLAQDIPDELQKLTVRQVLERSLSRVQSHDDWKIDVLLDEMHIPYEDGERLFSTFSGGWQRLMLIAAATSLEEPDILILDEPTNHLDIAHLNRLEDWLLNNTRVPMLIVSHDREFLNKITNRTIFLRPDGAHVFKAPFAQAREELLQRDEANAKQRHLEEKEIDRLHKMAMRYKAWGVLNSNFHKRQKATEKRIDRLQAERTDAYVAKDRELKLSDTGLEAKVALRLENLTVTTPDKSRVLYKIERLLIHPGDRIALLGANGAGKTMLLNAIAAAYDPKREHYDSLSPIRFSPSAKTVFFDQRMKQLPLDITPLAYVTDGNVVSRSNAAAVLAKAGFSYERSQNPIKGLSYGERSRLIFLRMRLLAPNFYLLDEPTNHLDIEGQEDLETQLEEAEVACLFVSHDRFFTRNAATRFMEIRNGKLVAIEDSDEFFDRQKIAA
ncbi:MAG TPA: ABC-F family ATP-binding cassette domain-containing protein [Caulobacterales bacterium]|jgi:ATPase subunit of ABC transporter with duplicated ATPase domains|nr:ABC-F family ATP-binding cassette domain-containing protein [Caulobacterales bacterium]